MSELIITDLESTTISDLEERATRNGRTPPEEAKAILTVVLASKPINPWAGVDAIFNRLAASGRTFSDSVELIREDRER